MTCPSSNQGLQLRDYQSELLDQLIKFWSADYRRLLLQLPTGAGKTVLFAAVAKLFTDQNCAVLVLVHREELLTQAIDKLAAVCGVAVGAIKAGYDETPEALIQVASVQTLMRRKVDLNRFNLVVIDEAHHGASKSYITILEAMPEAYHLGVTATPQRLDGKGLDGLFDHLISGVSVPWLIEQGYLGNYRLFAPAAQISTVGVKTTAGDFNLKQLHSAALNADVMGAVVPAWQQFAAGKQTIVFAVDCEHSDAIAALYREAGIIAEHLDGETPAKDRRAILAAFERREIQVLTNCSLFGEGLDIPGIEAVQILRPTKSLALYLQQIGRALRPSPGKTAIILDHTANFLTHGLPDDERQWSLSGQVLRRRRRIARQPDGEVVVVPEREISFDHSVELAEVTRRSAELEEVANPRLIEALNQLCDIAIARGYKPGWVAYRFLELEPGLPELRECARRLGYDMRWASYKLREIGGVA